MSFLKCHFLIKVLFDPTSAVSPTPSTPIIPSFYPLYFSSKHVHRYYFIYLVLLLSVRPCGMMSAAMGEMWGLQRSQNKASVSPSVPLGLGSPSSRACSHDGNSQSLSRGRPVAVEAQVPGSSRGSIHLPSSDTGKVIPSGALAVQDLFLPKAPVWASSLHWELKFVSSS